MFEQIKKCLPDEYVKLFNPKLYRYCFAYSKATFMYSGCKSKRTEADKERANQIGFIEVILFLCLLANELYKKKKAKEKETLGVKPLTNLDIVKDFITMLMATF